MRIIPIIAALTLGGCNSATVLPADPAAKLDPVAFFTGHTQGRASLDKLFFDPVAVAVDSVGRSDGRGGLIIDQIISKSGEPAGQRRWIFRLQSDGRYGGTLTDAAGPVSVLVAGPRAIIRYRMKNGMEVEQRLALQRDRRTLLNQLTVTKFGIQVARLDEVIRKLD